MIMMLSGGSLFLLKNFTLKVCFRRFISGVICFMFITILTHLVLMEPEYRHQRARFRLTKTHHVIKRSFSEEGHENHRNQTSNHCFNYVIFDAEAYSGKLSFLEGRPDGWCALVINLRDSLDLSTCSDCLILREEWMESHVAKLIEKKFDGSVRRDMTYSQLSKMAAYMFVLLQKPNWIFVTNRAIDIPYTSFARVTGTQILTGPVYQGPKEIFEPCNHFVDPVTLRRREGQGRYNIKVVSSHSVYHVLDSCHQQGVDPRVQKESFDNEAPFPYIMPGTYGAIDFNNVLVSYANAWTLVASILPRNELGVAAGEEDDTFHSNKDNDIGSTNNTTSNMSSSDTDTSGANSNSSNIAIRISSSTYLGFMVQRMLWETDATIGFIPGVVESSMPNGRTCRSCDAFTQMNATDKNYFNALLDWRCDAFLQIDNCFLYLTSNRIISNSSLEYLVHVWVFLLNEYKIQNPLRVPFSKEKMDEKQHGIPFYFSPSGLVKNDTTRPNPFRDMCKHNDIPYHTIIPEKFPVPKILLIVVFNFPFLVSHIPLLDYVYGRHFKHIVYCSENIADFEQHYQRLHPNNPVSWIEIKHHMGYWAQNCMSAAIKLGYDVRGYLQVSDDVIVNIWNLDKLPYNQPWFQSNMRVAHVDHEIVPDVWINKYWWPWSQFSGKKAALAAFNHLESMVAHPSDGDRVSYFMENIYNITNCDRCFLYEASDIFYLPSELGANFTFFSDIFSFNKVFLEITIPTVLAGITSDKELYRLRGNYLWFHDRDRYPYVYTEYDHFYHAWKLSKFGDGREVVFYCRRILSKIDKHLMLKGKVQGSN